MYYICLSAYVFSCIYVYIYVCVCIYIQLYVQLCIYVCVCVYIQLCNIYSSVYFCYYYLLIYSFIYFYKCYLLIYSFIYFYCFFYFFIYLFIHLLILIIFYYLLIHLIIYLSIFILPSLFLLPSFSNFSQNTVCFNKQFILISSTAKTSDDSEKQAGCCFQSAKLLLASCLSIVMKLLLYLIIRMKDCKSLYSKYMCSFIHSFRSKSVKTVHYRYGGPLVPSYYQLPSQHNCHTAIAKRNTANKEILVHKKIWLSYKKGLHSFKKDLFTKKKDLLIH